jgi:quercetin dioxygenase-like cupin family protein
MSKVRVHTAENVEWVTLRSLYPADLAAERSDAELDSTMAYHEQGTGGSLHLTEYNYLPHAKFDLHAHDQPEIIYVLEGTLLFGTRELGRGASVFIADHTLYEFAAGPAGLRMLVFMPDGRVKYFGKEDFLRLQAAKKPATVA